MEEPDVKPLKDHADEWVNCRFVNKLFDIFSVAA